jgi:hypothetical protein
MLTNCLTECHENPTPFRGVELATSVFVRRSQGTQFARIDFVHFHSHLLRFSD